MYEFLFYILDSLFIKAIQSVLFYDSGLFLFESEIALIIKFLE